MDLTKLYGSKVFNDAAMRKHLPKDVYESLKETRHRGLPLDDSIAAAVAEGMKDWAIVHGATHYTHWFQPMTNITAGKHDSFIEPTGDGEIMLEFSPKALVKGEPDASSFPSGGLRATFEARGYTTWDPTSPAFVKDGTLYIPTAFCSYTGEALDTKTPLLRSMEAVSVQTLRVLRALGNTTSKRVCPTVGAEQEYFLVDRDMYEQRLDLKICGRTLFGAKPPKGQELDDHYCGRIRLRVADFMKDLDEELWKLGIPSKTKHNEVAPAQHELAPGFDTANIACDHNQLTMETMRIIAKEHHLACLLHEKPFAGVNGSGKHNNYSLSTDDGINLLSPSKDPVKNTRFLVVLCAFIQAVDTYGDLLRLSASSAGNDQRLGACEAPPAIISIFLGEHLYEELISRGQGNNTGASAKQMLSTGVASLPELKKDDSDRNRTSPFAFTGNKFEFRMLGSSQSIAMSNVALNAMLAEMFEGFADRLEAAADVEAEINAIISDTLKNHDRIIYNGNNYSQEWVEEAARRGLTILNTSLEAYGAFIDPKNVELFERYHVFTPVECYARYEILRENYIKVLSIEAATMLEMGKRQIFPAVIRYAGKVAETVNQMKQAGVQPVSIVAHLDQLNALIESISVNVQKLESSYAVSTQFEGYHEHASYMRDVVKVDMEALRTACDSVEMITDDDAWPIPTYTDLLHRV